MPSGRFTAVVSSAVLFAMLSPVVRGQTSLLGGQPAATRWDAIGTAPGTSASVYSCVYFGGGASIPNDPLLTPLVQHESLFIYLVMNTSDEEDLNLFAVANPVNAPIWQVGYLSMNVPGYDNALRHNPALLYAGLDGVRYGFHPQFGGVLHPGEWTLVFFRCISGWQPVDAAIGTPQSVFINGTTLGPGPIDPGPDHGPPIIIGPPIQTGESPWWSELLGFIFGFIGQTPGSPITPPGSPVSSR